MLYEIRTKLKRILFLFLIFLDRAQTFCSPSITKKFYHSQQKTDPSNQTFEILDNLEPGSRLRETFSNSNYLGIRHAVNFGSTSTLNSSKNSLTDAEDYPDIKISTISLESPAVFETETSKPLDVIDSGSTKLTNVASCENIHGLHKSTSLRLPKRKFRSCSSDKGQSPSPRTSSTSLQLHKVDSTASELGSDKIAQKLTNFHDQTQDPSVFCKILKRFTDASNASSLYDIRWTSLKTQRAEMARARAGTQGPENVEIESFDLSKTQDYPDNYSPDDETFTEIDIDSGLSTLEKTVMMEPVGFIEDSFAVANKNRKRSTTISRPRQFSFTSNSDDVDSSSYYLNSKMSSTRVKKPSVELKSFRFKNECDDVNRVCEMIYKYGDDLRQDMLVMRAFDLMLDVSSDCGNFLLCFKKLK